MGLDLYANIRTLGPVRLHNPRLWHTNQMVVGTVEVCTTEGFNCKWMLDYKAEVPPKVLLVYNPI